MTDHTIPKPPYERTGDCEEVFIPHMAGPASSFAFCHKVLAGVFSPVLIFNYRLQRNLDTKCAVKMSRPNKSLAWALRAWCHANGQRFRYTADGSFIEFSERDDARTNSPAIRAQFLENGGWNLIRLNAFAFDWAHAETLKSFANKGIYLHVYQPAEDSPTGYVDILSIPDIDYRGDIIYEVQTAIDNLNNATLALAKHYNTRK